MEKEVKEIVIKQNTGIMFPKGEENGDILILGNFNGVCGEVTWTNVDNGKFEDTNFFKFQDTFLNNIEVLMNTLRAGNRIFIIASNETIDYFKRLLYTVADTFMDDMSHKARKKMFNKQVWTIDTTELYERTYVKYNSTSEYRKELAKRKIDDIVTNRIFEKIQHMKFDYIIQNPPYNGSLHLDFLEKGLDLLTEKGRMVIIEPATWLINMNPRSDYVKGTKKNHTPEIKKRIGGHVESVIIENRNIDFGVGNNVPYATTVIDMSKTFDTINFVRFGEKLNVKTIYDCNLIGDYNMVMSILKKCAGCGDVMENHVTKEDKGSGIVYHKYGEIVTGIMGRFDSSPEDRMVLKGYSVDTANGGFPIGLVDCSIRVTDDTIYDSVPFSKKQGRGTQLSNHKADCVYGTEDELKNWKHFIFTNKLPIFINAALNFSQSNSSKPFLPWLVDKQYTDEEINKLFGFTDEEIALIDRTIKKYERNSPWFKRYMCGPDSVSDEEVNNFINSL